MRFLVLLVDLKPYFVKKELPLCLPETFLLTMLICLVTSTTALAWNKPGHMLTGAIAYYELKAQDPAALETVINLVKKNPYYQHEWLPRIQNLAESDPDRHDVYLFMYPARWPDDIRGIPSLHCDPCHYINYRFKPDNQPAGLVGQPPLRLTFLRSTQRQIIL